MAVTVVLTGTGQNCTLTSGSNTITVTSATGLVIGATIQGTGIPTGARIQTISGTTVTMAFDPGTVANATASGTQSLIFSSVYGSTLTISMSASSDTATMDTVYTAGFGIKQRGAATREILFPGALTVVWSNIVAGAVFDFQNWTIEFGSGGRWQWSGDTIFGELRGGYLVNGTQFIKTAGPTFIANNFNNNAAGGSNMFAGTNSGTVTGTFRMNDLRVIEQAGSNSAPYFSNGRMNSIIDNMILDYQNDGGGANAGIAAAFGTLNNTYLIKANASIGSPNPPNFATFNGFNYVGLYSGSPQHKFSIPSGYIFDGYAPQVLSTQFLGGFSNNTIETYSNIDLSTAGWGVVDLKTKYLRYGGTNTLNFPRTVSLTFADSSATALTNVTLYIKSGSTSLVNAVQSGNFSSLVQALVLNWTTTTSAYRVADSITDTISQTAQIRKYGYIQQSTSYSLNLAKYSQPFFMLTDTSLSGISEATATAITTAGINWSTKTITPTGNLSYDQINARIAYELAQTTNSAQVEPRTISGTGLTLATGWTLVVNSGITISGGTNITSWYTPTITINSGGAITGLYQTTTGPSARLTFTGLA